MGEDKKRIYFTGAPQLEDIMSNKKFEISSSYFVVIFHPVLNEFKSIEKQVDNLINSIKKIKEKNFYWIFPNNDMGHNIILTKLKK